MVLKVLALVCLMAVVGVSAIPGGGCNKNPPPGNNPPGNNPPGNNPPGNNPPGNNPPGNNPPCNNPPGNNPPGNNPPGNNPPGNNPPGNNPPGNNPPGNNPPGNNPPGNNPPGHNPPGNNPPGNNPPGNNPPGNKPPTKGGVVGGLLGGLVNGVLVPVVDGLGTLVGGLVHGLLGGGGGKNGEQVDLSLNLQGLLRQLGVGLNGVGGNVNAILRSLANGKIPGTLDDVLNLLTGVGGTLGGVLDELLPGVGSAVSRLVFGLVKILICVLGSPGLTGNLLGDKRPGFKNPRDIPEICFSDTRNKVGVKQCSKDCDSAHCLYDFYDLDKIDDLLRVELDTLTDGEGLDGLEGSHYYIWQWLLELSALAKKRQDGNWCKDDTILVFINITKILGALGNSYKSDLGVRLCQQSYKYYKDICKDYTYFDKFDWDAYLNKCRTELSQCKYYTYNGLLEEQSDDRYNNVLNNIDATYTYCDRR